MAKRELELKPGYRWLAVGEVVVAGDEFWSPNTRRWSKTAYPGTVIETAPSRDEISYRRKIEPTQAVKPTPAEPQPLHETTKPGQKYLIKVGSSTSSTSFSDVTDLTQDYVGGFHILTFRGVSGRDVEVMTRETVVITPVTSV